MVRNSHRSAVSDENISEEEDFNRATTTDDRAAAFEDCLTLVFHVPQKLNHTSNSTKHPTEKHHLFVNEKKI